MQLLTKHFTSHAVGGHSWLGKTSALCIIPIAQLVDAQQPLAALTTDLTAATVDATAAHSATEAAVTELRRAVAAAPALPLHLPSVCTLVCVYTFVTNA